MIDHCTLTVGIEMRPEGTTKGEGADTLDGRGTDDLPILVDIVADQIGAISRELKFARGRAVCHVLVQNVVGRECS
jgi:hypothetical protein